MTRDKNAPFVFTGVHMLATMLGFFGVIIGVNVTMAYFAGASWSGMVVANSYVASQQFNDRTEQIRQLQASGIRGRLAIASGRLTYDVSGSDAMPVIADDVALTFKRPVGDHQDFTLMLRAEGAGRFTAERPVEDGHWIVEVVARRGGQIILHEASRIAVTGGSL